MTCQTTVTQQTEFEFFQASANTDTYSCCGPLAEIGFTGPALSEIVLALVRSGAPSNLLDNYKRSVLDSSHLSYTICSKHWIGIIQRVGKVAMEQNNETWLHLSFYIFRVLCLTNKWDHKEIVNYIRTLQQIN